VSRFTREGGGPRGIRGFYGGMTNAFRRRAVLAVAGLLAAADPARAGDLALGPWYLRVGGRFAGPVARVVSTDHPLASCTLELGAATAAGMSGMIDSALAGAGASEDITLFRGGTRGILGLELSGARVTSLTLPKLDAASIGEPLVQVRIAWRSRSVSRLPDSFVVAAQPPAAADPAPLTVRVDGQPVPADWVAATIPGDLTLAVPEAGTALERGAVVPVTVSMGRFAFAFAATVKGVQSPVFRLAVERAALRVTPA
jgi:hypothetical protein